jgi:hypothetical protein
MKKIFIIFPLILLIILVSVYIVKNRSTDPQIIAPVAQIPSVPVASLPNYHLIKTTFITQAPEKNWGEPWQDGCEEAAILTVKYYYFHQSPTTRQLIADLQALFQAETDLGFTHDVNTTQMATVSAKLFNLKPTIISNPNVETIKKYLSQDIPIIIPANGKILFKENPHFKSGGPWYHNLVILGYDDAKKQFIVHDVGTQFGAYFHYSYDLLISSIHDFPADGRKEDINEGAKNILVLVK